MRAKRGQCNTCGFRYRLRKDGMIGWHKTIQVISSDTMGVQAARRPCGGSHKPPRPLRFTGNGEPDCGECLIYLYSPATALLTEAIYSVSIESSKGPRQPYREYFLHYHDNGHREPE